MTMTPNVTDLTTPAQNQIIGSEPSPKGPSLQTLLQHIADAEAVIARNNVAIAEHEANAARKEAAAAKIEAAIAIIEEAIARIKAGAE
jgi:hypothetical protein